MVYFEDNNKIYRAKFELDEFAEDPRANFDNISQFIFYHPRYNIGDINFRTLSAWKEEIVNIINKYNTNTIDINPYDLSFNDLYTLLHNTKDLYVETAYMYDHSGISISTSNTWPYNDRWDSSIVGFVIVDKNILKNLFTNHSDIFNKEDIKYIIKNEISIYNDYLNGLCYQLTIEERKTYINIDDESDQIYKWSPIESICGLYGSCCDNDTIKDFINDIYPNAELILDIGKIM